MSEAAQQRDAADEGRLDTRGSIILGRVIVNQGKVVRPSQLIASVRQTEGEVARGTRILMARLLLTGLVVGCCTACMVSLHPRTTLEGRPFDAGRAETIHAGQTEAQVREVLGEPFQLNGRPPDTVWRYYERFTPRGCGPVPTVIREFRVTFVNGVVVSPRSAAP
jgi:outer membrane protein assembly factor BamE (lipoprotein component of BamABCDE complex)